MPGSLDWSGATVTTGALTLAAGTITAPTGRSQSAAVCSTYSASGAFVSNGTVSLTGASAATLGGSYPFVFNKLTVTNTGGVQLTAGVTVNGLMTMSGGAITTNGNQLYVSSTGSVTRTNGQVVGVLTKYIPAGSPAVTFEVGDATRYTPVSLSFNSVTSAGDLSVSTTTGDHPADLVVDDRQHAQRQSLLDAVRPEHRFRELLRHVQLRRPPTATSAPRPPTSSWRATTAAPGRPRQSRWPARHQPLRPESRSSATSPLARRPAARSMRSRSCAPATASAGVAFDVTITAVDSAGNRVANYTGTVDLSSSDAFAAFSPATYTFTLADNGV